MPKQQLKELSDAELAMHFTYMEERFKQLNKIKFDCKLPLGIGEYEILTVRFYGRASIRNH